MLHRTLNSFIIMISLILLPMTLSAAENDLPPELKGFLLKDGFFESQFPEAGSIEKITGTGKVLIVRRAVKEAFFAGEGDRVYENDALYTIRDCRCRVVFKDQNVAMLAPDSHFEIDEFHASLIEGKKKSLFASAKGKVILYALRLFSYRTSSLEFKTPTAVIGVRGTKFGTEIEKVKESDRSRVPKSMIAGLDPVFAQSDVSPGNFITRIYVLEGTVDVQSTIDMKVSRLRQNEILETDMTGLGDVRYDPEKTRTFTDEVLAESGPPPSDAPPETESREQIYQEQEVESMERIEDIKQQEVEPEEHTSGDEHHRY